MVYRAFLTAIVLFWLVMTGLLVRVELFPNKGNLVPVPTAFIWHLIFLRQQTSDLVLYNPQRQRLGTLYLHPQNSRVPEGEGSGTLNVLRGTGDATVNLPGLPKGRMTYSFTVEMTGAQQVQDFEWAATLHAPKSTQGDAPREPSWSFKIDGRPSLNQFHYLLRRDDAVLKEASGTPDALLADPDLTALGFDPRVIITQVEARQAAATAAGGGSVSQLAVTAHRGSLVANGEEIETFVVHARYADSLETTVHVSQLGQVLQVKTFSGYDLYDETLSP